MNSKFFEYVYNHAYILQGDELKFLKMFLCFPILNKHNSCFVKFSQISIRYIPFWFRIHFSILSPLHDLKYQRRIVMKAILHWKSKDRQ